MRNVWVFLFGAAVAAAQPYDLLLRGGHVIDPANHIDAVMDVGIAAGKVAAVRAGIPAGDAHRSVNVNGLYVVPGMVDLHAHVFGYEGSLDPDDTSLVTGATTIVDAGGSGWRTFDEFRRTVIAHAKTRVLVFLNIVGAGMVGEPAESNTADMDSAKTADMIMRNRDVIVGIKTAHFTGKGYTAIDRAVGAGRIASVPVMVDDHIFTNSERTTRDELLEHFRPGDIHTHMYNDRQIELLNRFTGKVQPYMLEARARGVKFDLGHGGGSFLWPVAAKAMAQGFWPDTISTDLHGSSIMGSKSDMPNCISKLMLLGMTLPDAILRSTVNPAQAIGRYPEIGTLGVGQAADVAVLQLETGVFAFQDAWGAKRLGNQRLENVMTIRAGKVVFEREGQAESAGGVAPPIYDILLKGGRVVDPANHRTGRMDVAVTGGKIARVAADLPAAHGRIIIDAGAYYVTPGLIDLDDHFPADHDTLRFGVTTAVPASTATMGEKTKTRWLELAEPERAGLKTANAIFTGPGPRTDMMTVISKALIGGGTVEQMIERATVLPARALHHPELGTLNEGAVADIAVIALDEGKFLFLDSNHERITANRRLRCALTIRNGAIVWDADGLSATDWVKAGPYTNFK